MNINDIAIVLTVFIVGLALGASLVRYGIGIGSGLVYKVKNDIPLVEEKNTEQGYTE